MPGGAEWVCEGAIGGELTEVGETDDRASGTPA